jgi:hypothetical protein
MYMATTKPSCLENSSASTTVVQAAAFRNDGKTEV